MNNTTGIRKPDGSFYTAADPISSDRAVRTKSITSLAPLFGQIASPRLEQPYTRQTNVGWSHQLDSATALTVDYVRVDGRDINIRFRPNTRINGGPRRLADLPIRPNTLSFRTAVSKGESSYDGLIIGLRRRMSHGFDLTAFVHAEQGGKHHRHRQRRARRQQHPGCDGSLQRRQRRTIDSNRRPSPRDAERGCADAVGHPGRADLHLSIGASARSRSKGVDLNNDSNTNDITARAYKYTGLNATARPRSRMWGRAKTVNCSRRAPFSQLNLRLSKSFRFGGTTRVEAIAEVFNLFNAKNPALPITSQRVNATTGAQQASFMQPVAYAGDFQQPEQRIGQIGFRFSF